MTASRVPVREDLAGVQPYGAPQLPAPVRLNTNETPHRPPATFYERLSKRISSLDLHRYPDRRVMALRAALAERFRLTADRVWVAGGSNEVLLQLFQAYGGPGRRLLLPVPGYSAHPLIGRVAGCETVSLPLGEGFELASDEAARQAAESGADVICVASPNNPTGVPVALDAIRALHEHSEALVIVDEAYIEFAEDRPSAVTLLDELPRLVVCRTFSKAWRLAGARLGYLLAHDWVVDDLRRVRLPYHVDSLVQEAGLAALEMEAEMTAHIAGVVRERQRLAAALARLDGVDVVPSAANFLLFHGAAPDLFDRLLARGVLVRDFSDAPGLPGSWFRVTIGTAEENNLFLAALEEAIA